MANVPVRVIVENLAPENGTNLTPFWVGFHNGNFDTYDTGRPASAGVESLSEDGRAGILSEEFALSNLGTVDGVVGNAAIAPGQIASNRFILDSDSPEARYFNYAAMILPSNDAFIANGNPKARRIFNPSGEFQQTSFIVRGNTVLDAGTENNDEQPANTAFFGQADDDTGTDENGVIKAHPGFRGSQGNQVPPPRILDDFNFSRADFTLDNYELARISVVEEKNGNNQNNTLEGTTKTDFIDGRGGNDNINGAGGRDFLIGAGGNDTLNGGGGRDQIEGGLGRDMLDGGAGRDMLDGGAGNDLLMAGLKRNASPTFSRTFDLEESQEVPLVENTDATGRVTATLDGMELSIEGTYENLTSDPVASHVHFGGKGFAGPVVQDLTLEGDSSAGTLSGTLTLTPEQLAAVLANNYYVNLHTENNPPGELRGQINLNFRGALQGGDKLMGGNGDDVLIGSLGDDMLDGGDGDDTLTGMRGLDTFVISKDAGSDLILDYKDNRDKIGLAGGLTFGDLMIEQGTSDDSASIESMNHTLIKTKADGDILAAVAFTSDDVFTAQDFMVV